MHYLHWFDFSPLCIIKCNLKLFEWTEENSFVCYQVVPQVACSKGCIITLVASIDFSPLCDFKCVLKLAGQVDAKLHWLHLFDLSPLCLFKSHWMHWFSFSPLRFHLRPQVSCLILCILAMVAFVFRFPTVRFKLQIINFFGKLNNIRIRIWSFLESRIIFVFVFGQFWKAE